MISFHKLGLDFQPKKKNSLRKWINAIAEQEKHTIGNINYVFCSEDELLKLNTQYLKHKSHTDIITFDYSDKNKISGDIFISVERVTENAKKYNTTFDDELHRVLIHGILHLCGYKDKTDEQEKIMRKKEDKALLLRSKLI